MPDWSRERDGVPFYWPTSQTAFNAANGNKHDHMEQEKFQVLRVKDKKVDSIKMTLEPRFEDLDDEFDINNYLRLEETCEI